MTNQEIFNELCILKFQIEQLKLQRGITGSMMNTPAVTPTLDSILSVNNMTRFSFSGESIDLKGNLNIRNNTAYVVTLGVEGTKGVLTLVDSLNGRITKYKVDQIEYGQSGDPIILQYPLKSGTIALTSDLLTPSDLIDKNIYNEIPYGVADGTNVKFYTYKEYKTNTTRVYLSGQRMTLGDGNDYIESNPNEITFLRVVPEDSQIIIDYTHI